METLNSQIWYDILQKCPSDSIHNIGMASLVLFDMMQEQEFFFMLCHKYGIQVPKSLPFRNGKEEYHNAISFARWKEIQLHFKKQHLWIRRIDVYSFPDTVQDSNFVAQRVYQGMYPLENGYIALLYLETNESFQKRWTIRFAVCQKECFIGQRFDPNSSALSFTTMNKESTHFFPHKQYSLCYQEGDHLRNDLILYHNGSLREWWRCSEADSIPTVEYTYTMDWNDNSFDVETLFNRKCLEFEPYFHMLGPSIPQSIGQTYYPFVALQPPRSNFHLLLQWN